MRVKSKNISHLLGKGSGYLFVSLLACLLFSLFFLFFHQFYLRSYVDQRLSALQIYLGSLQKDQDHVLELEQFRIDDLYDNGSVRSLIALGDQISDEELLAVEQELSGLVDASACYGQAVMYIYDSRLVLTAGQDQSGWRREQTAFEWGKGSADPYGWDSDGRMWVRYEFPESRPLACLQLYISQDKLFDLFTADENGQEVYLYTSDGSKILSQMMTYPEESHFFVRELVGKAGIYELDDSAYDYAVTAQSQWNGWLLILPVKAAQLPPAVLTVIQVTFPYLLGLSVLVLASAFGIRISRNRFARIQGEKEQYGQLLTHATPQLELQLLSDLLTGAAPDEEKVRSGLDILNSSLVREREFLPVLIQWDLHTVESALSPIRDFALKEELCTAVREIVGDEILFPNTGKREVTALIPAGSQSQGELKQLCGRLCSRLAQLAKERDCDVLIVQGPVCSHLEELRSAWQMLRREVERKKYLKHFDLEEASQAGCGQSVQPGVSAKILGWVDGVLRRNAAVREELFLYCQHEGEKRELLLAVLTELLDHMVERLLGMQAKGTEDFFQNRTRFLRGLSEGQWDEHSLEKLDLLCQSAAELYDSLEKREQYQHVQAAKEYIARMYWDSSLSLGQVSERLGISPSYLSTLFSKYAAQGFLDYLNTYRLSQAYQLLTQSDFTVSDIGFKTGFNSAQSFIRIFKKYYGQTPGQVRGRTLGGRTGQ